MKISDALYNLYENRQINKQSNELNITYENGNPFKYKDEFLKIWLIHMEYINSIQRFSTPKASISIFNESLNKFASKHRATNLFIAKENSNIIGFLQSGIAPNNKYGFISDLHVLENYRRLGIGDNLLTNCLNWFNENKVSTIGLDVTGGNEKALKFYKNHGFDIDNYSLKLKLN